jgi:hypothetical protein
VVVLLLVLLLVVVVVAAAVAAVVVVVRLLPGLLFLLAREALFDLVRWQRRPVALVSTSIAIAPLLTLVDFYHWQCFPKAAHPAK